MAISVSKTAMALFDTPTSRNSAEKTFVIFGSPRGGTTAVAGVARHLGLFLGDNLPDNLEDPSFHGQPIKAIRETIAERDEKHAQWGWKFPNAVNNLDHVAPHLRNSRYICVTRDLTANSLGIEARHEGYGSLRSLEHAMQNLQRNLSFVMRVRRPTLMLSYEKLALKPEAVVSEIAEFLMTEPSEEQRQAAIASVTPGKYQSQKKARLKKVFRG